MFSGGVGVGEISYTAKKKEHKWYLKLKRLENTLRIKQGLE